MKYLSFILMCFIWTTSFSQMTEGGSPRLQNNALDAVNVPWKIERLKKQKNAIVPTHHLPDTAVSKKIVIRYTTNSKGKVTTASYVSSESTSLEEQLIKEAKLKTMMAKPITHTPGGICYYGTYVFIFTAEGKLSLYFQESPKLWLIR